MARQNIKIVIKNRKLCSVCGAIIKMICQKDTGVCCETCRKKRDGE